VVAESTTSIIFKNKRVKGGYLTSSIEVLASQAVFSLASVALKTVMSLYANHISGPQSGTGVKTFSSMAQNEGIGFLR
jgi:hypothetical protein